MAAACCLLMIMSDYNPSAIICQLLDESANIALLCHSLLGCTLTESSTAVHLHCLKLYHCIYCHQSLFSIQAMTKVLYDLHHISLWLQVMYNPHLQAQFAEAFDVYLEILHCIKSSISTVLGWQGPCWKLCGDCPTCSFEVCNYHSYLQCFIHSLHSNLMNPRFFQHAFMPWMATCLQNNCTMHWQTSRNSTLTTSSLKWILRGSSLTYIRRFPTQRIPT